MAVQACEAGRTLAASVVARCKNVIGHAEGQAKARHWLKAAALDDPFIVYRWIFLDERHISPEQAQAAATALQKLAAAGDPYAQFCYAVMAREGKGVAQNDSIVSEFYVRAAGAPDFCARELAACRTRW